MTKRSLFWPLVLMAVGLVWLLVSLGSLPSENLWALYRFVPYLILLLGVGLVLRARWETAGRLASYAVIGLAVLAILAAAPLGWNRPPEWGCFGDRDCEWFQISREDGWWQLNLPDSRVPGSGHVVQEERPIGDFSELTVDFPAEVILRQGETPSLTITAEDNVLPQIETRVESGDLLITAAEVPYGERVNPTETVTITLTAPDLSVLDFTSAGRVTIEGLRTEALEVSLSGAGEILLPDLEVQSLTVNLGGAGSVEASGSAQDLEVVVSGLGSFSGGDLQSRTASGLISGMGSATLWVTGELQAEISGTGSLEYYGQPEVHENISGLGSVQGLGEK